MVRAVHPRDLPKILALIEAASREGYGKRLQPAAALLRRVVGICCYVVAGMAKDIPLGTVFRGGLWYIPAYIISIIVLMLSPYWTVFVFSNLVR